MTNYTEGLESMSCRSCPQRVMTIYYLYYLFSVSLPAHFPATTPLYAATHGSPPFKPDNGNPD